MPRPQITGGQTQLDLAVWPESEHGTEHSLPERPSSVWRQESQYSGDTAARTLVTTRPVRQGEERRATGDEATESRTCWAVKTEYRSGIFSHLTLGIDGFISTKAEVIVEKPNHHCFVVFYLVYVEFEGSVLNDDSWHFVNLPQGLLDSCL